ESPPRIWPSHRSYAAVYRSPTASSLSSNHPYPQSPPDPPPFDCLRTCFFKEGKPFSLFNTPFDKKGLGTMSSRNFLCGQLYRLQDFCVSGAAAEISRQGLANLVASRLRVLIVLTVGG